MVTEIDTVSSRNTVHSSPDEKLLVPYEKKLMWYTVNWFNLSTKEGMTTRIFL